MDLNSAMETYAEAWVAATTQTPILSHQQQHTQEDVDHESHYSTSVRARDDDVPRANPHSPTGIKNIMLHCVVEQCSGPPTFDSSIGLMTSIEKDGHVSLPSCTLVSELIRSALLQLNYATTDTMTAIGAIQINNWKLLSFDQITNDLLSMIGDLFSSVASAVTLRIRICSEQGEAMEWSEDHVRTAVMDLLKTMSQTALSKISPLSQPLISYISNGSMKYRIGHEKSRQFSEWYKSFKAHPDFLTPDINGHTPHDSRLRFHTTQELPLMRNWYKFQPLPTDDDLRFYLSELNRGLVRQERTKISLNHLRIWWKNERQRLRKVYRNMGQELPRKKRGPELEQGEIPADRSRYFTSAEHRQNNVSPTMLPTTKRLPHHRSMIPPNQKCRGHVFNAQQNVLSVERMCNDSQLMGRGPPSMLLDLSDSPPRPIGQIIQSNNGPQNVLLSHN